LASLGLPPEEAWARLAGFLAVFPLILPSTGVLDRARRLHVESKLSFRDSLIVAASLEAGVETLFSEDLPGRIVPGLRVRSMSHGAAPPDCGDAAMCEPLDAAATVFPGTESGPVRQVGSNRVLRGQSV
jgi:hypothetical protein